MSDEAALLGDSLSSLGLLRQQITAVDQRLLTLLAERQQLVCQVGHYKLQRQLPYYDPLREQQLLQILIVSGQKQQLATEYIAQLFRVIFQHSLALQQQLSTVPLPAPVGDGKPHPSVNTLTLGMRLSPIQQLVPPRSESKVQ